MKAYFCGVLLLVCSLFSRAETVHVIAGEHWRSSDVYHADFMLEDFDDSHWDQAILLYNGSVQPEPELGGTPLMWHYQGVDPYTAETLPLESYFRTTFMLTGQAEWRGLFNYYANDEMDLYINGQLAVRDRSGAGNKTFGVDVSPWLQAGENTLAIYAYDGGALGPYERGMNWVGLHLEVSDVSYTSNALLLMFALVLLVFARKKLK